MSAKIAQYYQSEELVTYQATHMFSTTQNPRTSPPPHRSPRKIAELFNAKTTGFSTIPCGGILESVPRFPPLTQRDIIGALEVNMSRSWCRCALCLSLFLYVPSPLVRSQEKLNDCKSLISPDEEELKKAANQSQPQSSKAGVGVNLSCADLKGRDLRSFVLCDADLSGADLRGADLRNVNLTGADLTGANLGCQEGAHDSKSRCEGKSTNLEGAHLSRANLSHSILDHALMAGAVLSSDTPATDPEKKEKTDLTDHTSLRDANLTGANLTDVDLTGADMREADLSNAELAKSDMSDVDLEDCIYEPKSSPDVSDITAPMHSI